MPAETRGRYDKVLAGCKCGFHPRSSSDCQAGKGGRRRILHTRQARPDQLNTEVTALPLSATVKGRPLGLTTT